MPDWVPASIHCMPSIGLCSEFKVGYRLEAVLSLGPGMEFGCTKELVVVRPYNFDNP